MAINAAITAANVCKATVRLASGSNYVLADQIFLPNSTAQFAIEGYGATLNGAALNKPIVQVGDFSGLYRVAQYIRLSGFVISGAGSDAATHAASHCKTVYALAMLRR